MSTIIDMDYPDDSKLMDAVCGSCNGSTVPECSGHKCLCSVVDNQKLLMQNGKLKQTNFLKKLHLRFLEAQDVGILKELCQEWFPIKYPDTWFNLVVFDRRFFSLAATLDEKVIAVFIAEIKPRWQVPKEDADLLSFSFGKNTKIAYILSIGVHKQYRRHGVASFLLENFLFYVSACLDESNPVKAVYLHVLTTNLVAINFYENHSFKRLHFLPSYYVINGCYKDGYSYVLYVNGGKAHNSCLYFLMKCYKLLCWIQCCRLPTKMCVSMNYVLRYFSPWPSITPPISRSRQSHNM